MPAKLAKVQVPLHPSKRRRCGGVEKMHNRLKEMMCTSPTSARFTTSTCSSFRIHYVNAIAHLYTAGELNGMGCIRCIRCIVHLTQLVSSFCTYMVHNASSPCQATPFGSFASPSDVQPQVHVLQRKDWRSSQMVRR